jgi:hypothetical protein
MRFQNFPIFSLLKKAAAILLSALLLFNWVGYSFLTHWMEDSLTSSLDARIDGHELDESQLISVKIPAGHVSLYTNTRAFARAVGQVEVNGVHYQFVKKRLYNDSLEFICVPNQDVTRLQLAKNDFLKQVADLQQAKKSKASNTYSGQSFSCSGDYELTGIFCRLPHFIYSQPEKISSSFAGDLPLIYLLTADKPPKTPGQQALS